MKQEILIHAEKVRFGDNLRCSVSESFANNKGLRTYSKTYVTQKGVRVVAWSEKTKRDLVNFGDNRFYFNGGF